MNLIVVGQGYVGLPIAVAAAKANFVVYGFDTDKLRIQNLRSGLTDSPEVTTADLLELQSKKKINFVHSIPKISEPCIFVIAVPTPLDKDRKPDISMLKKACEFISAVVSDGSLIINESTSYIGTLNSLIKPAIDSSTGFENLDYAVAPERIDPGNVQWNIKNTPRLVGGTNERSSQRAFDFYSTFCEQVHKVSKPEVAEAAKLFENTFRQVNIALVNELSSIAFSIGFSTHEAIKAASTKPFGFMPFYPSIGVGGHCIPVDPTYLAFSGESAGVEAKFINLANMTNTSMPKNIAERIKVILGGNLSGKRIQIAGISYKPNISDIRESPALELMRVLTELGANVLWCDPHVEKYNGDSSTELDAQIDLGLIITPHDKIDFSIWKKAGTLVLDLSANSSNYGWLKFL